MKKILTIGLVILMLMTLAFGIYAAALGSETVTASPEGKAFAVQSQDGLPEIDTGDWSMTLVNADKPVSSDFLVTTGVTKDGYLFDFRAIAALDEMLEAGRDKGMKLALTSAYRTYDYQNMLFTDKVSRVINETGLDLVGAEEAAAREVARPGTSEHNLGLAADIVCDYYGILDEGYADTPEAMWLHEHCAEYGFILRYDKGKESLTGIEYEPWHFRYVGKEAAKYIMENDLCLEEFLALYE